VGINTLILDKRNTREIFIGMLKGKHNWEDMMMMMMMMMMRLYR
jgi:hypothetical protein